MDVRSPRSKPEDWMPMHRSSRIETLCSSACCCCLYLSLNFKTFCKHKLLFLFKISCRGREKLSSTRNHYISPLDISAARINSLDSIQCGKDWGEWEGEREREENSGERKERLDGIMVQSYSNLLAGLMLFQMVVIATRKFGAASRRTKVRQAK